MNSSNGRICAATIDLRSVTKRYRAGGGVNDLTLSIGAGEIFGFLGPNGAGKTTTIRLMLDLIRPDAGEIKIFGLDSRTDSVAIRRRLGYIPGELALYDRLSAREILSHFAHLRGRLSMGPVVDLANEFDLELDRPVRTLSKGNRQKVGLVGAFMGTPDLLLLDEPTSGLDPLVQQQVHQAIRRVADEGCTVFLCSHALSEVGEIAARVGLIRDGHLAAVERVSDLRQRSVHQVEATFNSLPDLTPFRSLVGSGVIQSTGNSVYFEVTGDINPLIGALAATSLSNLCVREPTLEEMFFAFYGKDHG